MTASRGMEGGDGSDTTSHFVLLQHGSHGTVHNMGLLVRHLTEDHGFTYCRSKRAKLFGLVTGSEVVPLEELALAKRIVFDTDVNHRWRTDGGTETCVQRLYDDVIKALRAVVAALASSESRIRFSCVGHSYGGILNRALLVRIHEQDPDVAARIDWHHFVSISTPHLGSRGMNPVLFGGGVVLSKLVSRTYAELLLQDGPDGLLSGQLLEDGALRSLAAFKSRRLYGSVNKDILVPFKSASLLVEGVRSRFNGVEPTPEATLRDDAPCRRVSKHLLPSLHVPAGDVPQMDGEDGHPSDETLEVQIARRLRAAMSFDIVPAVCDNVWHGAHTCIVSQRLRPWETQMDDVSAELASFLAKETVQ